MGKVGRKRACRIKYENLSFNVYDRENWDKMVQFLSDGMFRLERGFKEPLKKINAKLKK